MLRIQYLTMPTVLFFERPAVLQDPQIPPSRNPVLETGTQLHQNLDHHHAR